MLLQSMFPRDIFAEMVQLHRQMEQFFDFDPSIRGIGAGRFPDINVGSTPHSLEVYAFVPGFDPKKIEVTAEPGVLTLSGKRDDVALAAAEQKATVHLNERFAGSFKRVVSLPEDIDPDGIDANYRDGVLHISIKRRQEAQPKRISVH